MLILGPPLRPLAEHIFAITHFPSQRAAEETLRFAEEAGVEPAYEFNRFGPGQHPPDLCRRHGGHQSSAELVTFGEGRADGNTSLAAFMWAWNIDERRHRSTSSRAMRSETSRDLPSSLLNGTNAVAALFGWAGSNSVLYATGGDNRVPPHKDRRTRTETPSLK
jgi:hypothetical protein